MKGLAIIAAWLMMLLPAPVLASSRPLTIYYFHRPPLYIAHPDGSAGGVLIDVVVKVLQAAGVPYQLVEMPSKRILMQLREEDYACGVGWFFSEERAAFAAFSAPIYQDRPLVLVVNQGKRAALAERPTMVQALASGLTLGVVNGFSYGAWADRLLAEHKPPLEAVTGQQAGLLHMAARGRVDYVLMDGDEAQWLLDNDAGLRRGLTVVDVSDAPAGNLRHIMFSKSVDQDVIARINAAIEQMVRLPGPNRP